MKQNHTDITIVLDRSGSMASVAADTIGGFNQFLADQRKIEGSAAITLHQFDNEFETVIKAQDIQTAPNLTTTTFVPRGNTALFDAIGRAIIDTGTRIESTPENGRPEKVVFVIVTDGHENASKEYDRPKVFEMLTHQREKYAWEFVFLGANQDAIKTAAGLGVSGSNSMTYAGNRVGTAAAVAAVSANLGSLRTNRVKSMAFTDADREMQAKAGVKAK